MNPWYNASVIVFCVYDRLFWCLFVFCVGAHSGMKMNDTHNLCKKWGKLWEICCQLRQFKYVSDRLIWCNIIAESALLMRSFTNKTFKKLHIFALKAALLDFVCVRSSIISFHDVVIQRVWPKSTALLTSVVENRPCDSGFA